MSQKPITIKDLAEQLNISVSTVSRALKEMCIRDSYLQDLPKIQEEAENLGLRFKSHNVKENWAVVIFNK